MSFVSAYARRALTLLAFAALLPGSQARAQSLPAATSGPALSRIDLYGGAGYYRFLHSGIDGVQYQDARGGVFGLSGFFTHHFGVELQGDYFPNASDDSDCIYGAQIGPIARFQKGRFVPFIHALGGAEKIGGPSLQPCNSWGWGVTGGVGTDIILPPLHDRFGIRLQADYVYTQIDNGPLLLPAGVTGGFGSIQAIKYSGGFTVRFGNMRANQGAGDTAFTCSADPSSPFPGDPVTLSANAINFKPMKKTAYQWASTGGKVSGIDATATVDTSGLAPGSYDVSGKLVQGDKQKIIATCMTAFTVRAFEPPTLSCTADRAAINSGDPVTITSTGVSPQNRPLTYSYTTSTGQITGNGATAALSTAGTSPGTITVNCKVSDDKGQMATATAAVVVATPAPPPPAAQAQALCSIAFDRDRRRPDRVDNEAKGCLDDIALSMNRDATAKLVLVGTHTAHETNNDSAQRALNAAQYLTKEKGIDPARLDLRTGDSDGRAVSATLVPTGASFDGPATTFDAATVKRTGQAYGVPGAPPTHKARKRRRRPAATAAAPPPA